MEWNVWVIKPYGITNRKLSNGSCVRERNISSKYLPDVRLLSVEILLFDALFARQFSSEYNVVRCPVRNRLVCCLRIKCEKS